MDRLPNVTVYKHLLIALRGEVGEKNGRFHFHCPIGGTSTRNYVALAHQAEWLWKTFNRGARVDVRLPGRREASWSAPALWRFGRRMGCNAFSVGEFVGTVSQGRRWWPIRHGSPVRRGIL